MFSLQEVLDKHDLVLVDGSAKSLKRKDITKHLNPNDPDFYSCATSEIQRLRRLLALLNSPQTRTISEVSEEIRGYYKILDSFYRYFSAQSQCPTSFLKSLKKLRELGSEIYRASNKISFQIKHPCFEELVKMTVLLSRTLDLKSDTNYLKGCRSVNLAYDSEVDERVCSTLFWESMFENTCPVLLTNDRDFEKLLSVVPWIIGSKHFLPYNRDFRTGISKNRFRAYKVDNQKAYKLAFPDYAFDFQDDEKFWIPEKYEMSYSCNRAYPPSLDSLSPRTPKQTIPIYHQLFCFWREFSEKIL